MLHAPWLMAHGPWPMPHAPSRIVFLQALPVPLPSVLCAQIHPRCSKVQVAAAARARASSFLGLDPHRPRPCSSICSPLASCLPSLFFRHIHPLRRSAQPQPQPAATATTAFVKQINKTLSDSPVSLVPASASSVALVGGVLSTSTSTSSPISLPQNSIPILSLTRPPSLVHSCAAGLRLETSTSETRENLSRNRPMHSTASPSHLASSSHSSSPPKLSDRLWPVVRKLRLPSILVITN